MNMHELPPLRNQYTRACSRKRPTMECTVMFSLTPGSPGSRQQMPRTMSRTFTPAMDAMYSARIDLSVHEADCTS